MTIIEAVKSEKKFKRNGDRYWREPFGDSNDSRSLLESDILADDWAVEEEKIEITRTQLNEALSDGIVQLAKRSGQIRYVYDSDLIAKKLGFKD